VAKAGTTHLHTLLANHPQIFMSTPKEPHFLAAPEATPETTYSLNVIRDEAAYLRLFAGAGEPLRGESSTTNWWHPETAGRIDAFSPGSYAIVILRDPVERAFSHYLNDVRDSHERRPFDATLPEERPGPKSLRWGDPLIRVELGFYEERLRAYREVFGERLLLLFSDELLAAPSQQLDVVIDFLDLERSTAPLPPSISGTNAHRMPRNQLAQRVLRSDVIRRNGRRLVPQNLRHRGYESLMRAEAKPEMDSDSRRRLCDLYADDSAKLANMLGRALPWPTHPTGASGERRTK
jgi:hypothetical protein